MTKTPALRGLLAGLVMVLGTVSPALAQGNKTTPKQAPPTPEKMLDPRLGPKNEDVSISVPTPDELAGCTVTQVFGKNPGSSGWLLKDAKGQALRRFFANTPGGLVDMWSYYKDGIEVYREFDTASKGVPNNFRWVNAGGMKWGVGTVDARGKAVIQAWRMISAEEVGFEAFQAVAKQDFARLQILFITADEMQSMKLSANRITATLAIQQQAQKKFADLTKAVNLGSAKFDIIETAVPQCETTSEGDVIKFASRPVRYKITEKDLGWLYMGEMIQVGMAWKLVDVPNDRDPTGMQNTPKDQPELQKLLELLTKLDINPPSIGEVGGRKPEVDAYLRQRIALVQKIIPLDKADQREGWYRQLFDNLMAMSQNTCDDATLGLLKKLSDDVATQMPGSPLAAYGSYRFHWTTYAVDMINAGTDTKKITAAQDKWLTNLADFAKKYSKAEDTPESLYHLGNGCEFAGKFDEAKRWYGQLADGFPNHHLAPRAKGCVARLNLVGNPLVLTAPLLYDPSKQFDVASLTNKVVIVHFWSSQSEQYKDDFVRLSRLMKEVGTKQNVELVCISVDDSAAKAKEAIQKTDAPGIHLYQAPPNNSGGSNSPLATQYGIHMLPTVFVVGRNGRVTSNGLQIGDIEMELKRVP